MLNTFSLFNNKRYENWPKLYNSSKANDEYGLYLNVTIEFNTPILNTQNDIQSALTIEGN